MRDHWRTLIEEACRMQDATARCRPETGQDPALRLARETIRLARLATATHLVMAARPHEAEAAAEPAARGGSA